MRKWITEPVSYTVHNYYKDGSYRSLMDGAGSQVTILPGWVGQDTIDIIESIYAGCSHVVLRDEETKQGKDTVTPALP